jgi:hypothetical protein
LLCGGGSVGRWVGGGGDPYPAGAHAGSKSIKYTPTDLRNKDFVHHLTVILIDKSDWTKQNR